MFMKARERTACVAFTVAVSAAMFLVTSRIATAQPALQVFHSFDPATEGSSPNTLVQDSAGNFYGTTVAGGSANGGTVFRMTPGGTVSTLHEFPFGQRPTSALVRGAADGNFYGTTQNGGAANRGTVFKITPGGVFSTLHSFTGAPTDGDQSYSALIQGLDGNFYGTTINGGVFDKGTIYRITPGGSVTILHDFSGDPTDGAAPWTALLQRSDGSFWGTTRLGGTVNQGTAFWLTSAGTFTVLHSFGSAPEFASTPVGALVFATDGNFYGTTSGGGAGGTVFRMASDGTVTFPHVFQGGLTDGAFPSGALLQASDGNLYGTTQLGGSIGNWGTAFKLTLAGAFTILDSFNASTTGIPSGDLRQALDGNLYGVGNGGGLGGGVSFRLTTAAKATLLSPTPGFALNATSATFTWSVGPGASDYWFELGTSVGQHDLFGQDMGLATSQTVSGLPYLGSAIYARLWTELNGSWQFNDYIFPAFYAKASMASPTPGTVLTGSTVTFSWLPGTGATSYWLEVGASAGQSNLFGQSTGLTTNQSVSSLPILGAPVYVRLWTQFTDGSWQSSDYTYIASNARAVMTSPAPGSVLNGSTVTFSWTPGTSATSYWLEAGTSVGQGNLFSQSTGLTPNQSVSGLPILGGPVYVRLWTQFADGSWQSNDYTYTAPNAKAAMTSPAPGSVLSGSSVTFNWNAAGGASQYWLEIGTAAGAGNLFEQSVGLATSQIVSGLPNAGGAIYVRLWSQVSGNWLYNDYTYAAFNARATMTSPAPGAVLSGSSVTFTWSAGTGATAYWLEVGTGVGQSNLFGQSTGLATSQIVTGLPVLGGIVYARLWTQLSGNWVYNDYIYTAFNAKAVMTSPVPGSALITTSVTFTWLAGTGAASYWLEVGTSLGASDLFGQSVGVANSKAVNGIPLGNPIYVRLWTQLGVAWFFTDYTYSAVNPIAAIASPAPGSLLTESLVPFTWTAVPGASEYWLDIGSAPNDNNLFFSKSAGTSTHLDALISMNGAPFYVRLWTMFGGVWRYADYTYQRRPPNYVTVTFDGAGSNGSAYTTSSTSGYSVDAKTGTWTVNTTGGNPAPFIQFLSPPNAWTTVEVIIRADSPFHFVSVDIYSGLSFVEYSITATSPSGLPTLQMPGTARNPGGFVRVTSPGPDGFVGQVSIKLTGYPVGSPNPVGVDNIKLSY